MSTGRLSALVGYAAVPWFVHLAADGGRDRHRRPTGGGGRPRRRRDRATPPRAGAAHGDARHRRRRRRRPGPRRSPDPRARDDRARPHQPRRRRRAADVGLDGRARTRRVRRGLDPQPPVVDRVVMGRPGGAVAGRSARPRARRRGGDGDRAGPLRATVPCPVRAGADRPAHLPGLAPDVGGPRRGAGGGLPPAGGAPGPRLVAVPVARRRAVARAGRPRHGDLGGGRACRLRRGRRRAHVRLAPAARVDRHRRRRRRRRARTVHALRRRLVRPPGQHDRGGRGAVAAGGVGRRLPRALPRRPAPDPVPVRRPRRRGGDGAGRRRSHRPP